MGEVVSLSEAAANLAPLKGEVTALSASREAMDGQPIEGLSFRQGELVQVHYRAFEGRPETISVMFGPAVLEVVQALCRRLARSPERIIAVEGAQPDRCWICDAQDHVAGDRLAQLKGMHWTILNAELGHDGDDVEVHYRAFEGRPEAQVTLRGPTNREVVDKLCAALNRPIERLIATPSDGFEQCWICDADGRVAGERLALVKGMGWSLINVLLKKPDFVRLPKLSALPPASVPVAASQPAWMNDPDDERAWLAGGAYLPTPHGDPLSEDYE